MSHTALSTTRDTACGPSFICETCCHPSIAVYPPPMGEQPLNGGILDLATHKACGMTYHYATRWALTPPFHPYHFRGGYFLSRCLYRHR